MFNIDNNVVKDYVIEVWNGDDYLEGAVDIQILNWLNENEFYGKIIEADPDIDFVIGWQGWFTPYSWQFDEEFCK